MTEASDALREAADTMRAVRERCVWSQQITHRDLVAYLMEESHEVIDAVESGSRADLREELGDLLWQVLFHAAIAAQDPIDPFDIDDVAHTLTEKMVRRHPHVFADAIANSPDEVLVHWNAAKDAEKRSRQSVLDGVPRSMPALALAQKFVGRAASVGVATPAVPIADAVTNSAVDAAAAPASESELGEALLALVTHARSNGWDAERALRERLRLLESEVRTAESH